MFANKQLLEFIQNSMQQQLDLVVTSVIQTQGSTFCKAGQMMIVNSKMEVFGVLGSPYLHEKIFESSKEALKLASIATFDSIPKDESSGHGSSKFLVQPFFYDENYGALGLALNNIGKTLIRSIVDGSFEIIDEQHSTKIENNHFYQTIQEPYSLLIFGSASHVSPVIDIANIMGWKTTVVDTKIRHEYVLNANKCIELNSADDINSLDLSSYNASVILSHSPTADKIYLGALINTSVEYVGMMGNKKNMQRFIQEFNLQEDNRFFAPVGLDIGGHTSHSIALSICAQIEARKNKKI